VKSLAIVLTGIVLLGAGALVSPPSAAAQAACETHAALSPGLAAAPALAGLGNAIQRPFDRVSDTFDAAAAGEDVAAAAEQPQPSRSEGDRQAVPAVPIATAC